MEPVKEGVRLTLGNIRDTVILLGIVVMLGIYGWGWAENNLIVKSRLATQVQELQQRNSGLERDLAAERAKAARAELAPSASAASAVPAVKR